MSAELRVRVDSVEFTSMVAPAEHTMWQAIRLRDGKACWWANFREEREALEAVGLSAGS